MKISKTDYLIIIIALIIGLIIFLPKNKEEHINTPSSTERIVYVTQGSSSTQLEDVSTKNEEGGSYWYSAFIEDDNHELVFLTTSELKGLCNNFNEDGTITGATGFLKQNKSHCDMATVEEFKQVVCNNK